MQLTAIMPVRNEAWVLGLSARVALMWCDSLVILDHASTDSTPRIIEELCDEYPGRVFSISEPSPRWAEMEHRQLLLEFARAVGATHIAPVDADEVLCGDMLATIRENIEALAAGESLQVKMRNLHRSIHQYRSDSSPFGSQATTMLAFADSPRLRWANRNGYEHHQRSPHGSRIGRTVGGSGVMHLQFASWRRLTAKHALYKAMERTKYPTKSVNDIDKTYSLALNERGLACSTFTADWWGPYAHLMQYLDLDAEPWQEAETRRVVLEHGRETFNGLDLLGVA